MGSNRYVNLIICSYIMISCFCHYVKVNSCVFVYECGCILADIIIFPPLYRCKDCERSEFSLSGLVDVILIRPYSPNKTRARHSFCGELMCAAHVALIDLGWIYEQTQEVLQGVTGPVHYQRQTDQHTLWHYIISVSKMH